MPRKRQNRCSKEHRPESVSPRAVALLVAVSLGVVGCAELGGTTTNDADQTSVADKDTAAVVDVWAPDGWSAAAPGECDGAWHKVSWVADGDTLFLASDEKVRFLGIDTPETASKDCYAFDAKDWLTANAPKDSEVCLSSDSKAGNKDNYDRLLRYVFVKREGAEVMLNARLLRLGLARVYDSFAKGLRHEQVLRNAAGLAKADTVGGWKACGW